MTNTLPAKTASKTGRVARSVLMRPDEVRDIKSAADYAGRDDRTIRRWAKHYGIGRQSGPGAPIEISLPALEMVLHGEWEALEKLRRRQIESGRDPDIRSHWLGAVGVIADVKPLPRIQRAGMPLDRGGFPHSPISAIWQTRRHCCRPRP